MTTTLPAITEAQFQVQIVQLAAIMGWANVHFRPAQTRHGWRTPVSGPLGAGWPDLVLVRGERLLFVELKRDGGKLTPAQEEVLRILGGTGAECYVWRPRDFDAIAALLGAS